MKMFKKISAIVLVVAMMLTMVSFTAFAAAPDITVKITKSGTDTEVSGVKAGTKVDVALYITPGEYIALTLAYAYNDTATVNEEEITTFAGGQKSVADGLVTLGWSSTFTATADEPVATIPMTVDSDATDGNYSLFVENEMNEFTYSSSEDGMGKTGNAFVLPFIQVSGTWEAASQEAVAVDVPVGTREADAIAELPATVTVKNAEGTKTEVRDVENWTKVTTYDGMAVGACTFEATVVEDAEALATIPSGFKATATVNVTPIVTTIPDQDMTVDFTGSAYDVAAMKAALPGTYTLTVGDVTEPVTISWDLAAGETEDAIVNVDDTKAFTGTVVATKFDVADVNGTVTVVNNLNYRDVVATIGNYNFATLQAAVNSDYSDGADIVLYNNPNEWIDPATATTVDKNVTIDLNDKIYTGASITVEDGNTVTFKGNGTVNADITGDIVVEDEAAFYGDLSGAKVTAAAGSFPADTDVEVAEAGLRVATLGDGRLAVVKGENEVTDKIYLEFRPTAERNVFEIYIEAEEGKDINEFVSAEFDFENNSMGLVSGGYVDYTIVGAAGIEAIEAITADPDKTGESRTWGFYVNDKDDHNAIEPAAVILLGTVTFDLGVTAPGTIDFKAVDGVVHTNKVGTNDEYHYYVAADLAAGAVGGELDFADSDDDDDDNDGDPSDDDEYDGNITGDEGKVEPAERNLVVNVNFVNDIMADVDVDYNDMKVSITTNYPGFDAKVAESDADAFVSEVALGEPNTNTNDSATFRVYAGFRYTVTVEGAGYRTARYTTIVGDDTTDDLNLYFWNDVKNGSGTPYQEIEVGVSGLSAKNFLAGDIVMDGLVDKYDLAAVASYFGTYDLDDAHLGSYVKYDLNRDGQIDSEDIAYVLYSIGE